MISSDNLNVPSEEEVYRAVLSWVKHDIDGRRQHVPWVRLVSPHRRGLFLHIFFLTMIFNNNYFSSISDSPSLSPLLADEVCAAAASEARLSDE